MPETCDIHKYLHRQPNVPAVYDGKTVDGPWAFMCEVCFRTHGIGTGVGKGKKLTDA